MSPLIVYLSKVAFLVKPERLRLALLLPLYLMSATLDLIGLGLLLSLVTVIHSPNDIFFNVQIFPIFSEIINQSAFYKTMAYLCVAILVIFLFKTAIIILVTYTTLKITFFFGARLRSRLMLNYQNLSYENFTNRSASEYIYNVHTLAGQLISLTVQPILKVISDVLLILMILAFIALNDPSLVVVLTVVAAFGLTYDFINKKRMISFGKATNVWSERMVKHVTEAINGFRESIVFGKKGFFLWEGDEKCFWVGARAHSLATNYSIVSILDGVDACILFS